MSSKSISKICSLAALMLLVIAALGPAKLVPRSGLGWQIDHIVGYFAFTFLFCLAWPRPSVVGGAIMALALLLECLQALTPDRHADLHAALYSAGGALAAILPADLFIRTRLNWRTVLMLQRFRLRWPFWSADAKLLGTAVTAIGGTGQSAFAITLAPRSSLEDSMIPAMLVYRTGRDEAASPLRIGGRLQ